MRQWRFIVIGGAALCILGILLVAGILSSRNVMLGLLKDEARSFLSVVALTQENSIFAEAKFEDEIIDRLMDGVHYLESGPLEASGLERFRQHYGLLSILILSPDGLRTVMRSGDAQKNAAAQLAVDENLYYEYYTFRSVKNIRVLIRSSRNLYQFEYPARDIEDFRKDFGINRMLTQLSANPMIRYLVLQDEKGIIFATPNIKTISRIEGDSLLSAAFHGSKEVSRVVRFETKQIMELAQPFVIDGSVVGVFRIGISLDSYQQHLRQTQNQLILLFVILFMVIALLLLYAVRMQSYVDREELFSKTLSAIGEGVIQVNRRGIITGVNQALCTITGLEERQVLRQPYASLFPDDPFDIEAVLKKNMKFEDERTAFDRHVQFGTYPLLDTGGHITGAISIIRDVTEIRMFEKERAEAERLSFLGNLVANFAHEIKNPLNGLSIATQRLIREHPSEDTEYNELTTGIKKGIDSLNKILNDFLSLARPRLKEKVGFDLGKAMRETILSCQERIKEANIDLKESIIEGFVIAGNPDDFKRALLNILLNALEAVSSRPQPEKIITIFMKEDGPNIILSIADNGIGMDEEEKSRIFTPYFTTKKGGTGLGLFIAQKIIGDHQGRITVSSTKGTGTEFHISFAR